MSFENPGFFPNKIEEPAKYKSSIIGEKDPTKFGKKENSGLSELASSIGGEFLELGKVAKNELENYKPVGKEQLALLFKGNKNDALPLAEQGPKAIEQAEDEVRNKAWPC